MLGVMATLVAIIVPNVTSYVNKAEIEKANATAQQVYTASAMIKGVDGMDVPRYGYSDPEDTTEFMKELKKILNYEDEKFIVQRNRANTEIRVWVELGDGRRVKLKDGKIYKKGPFKKGQSNWGKEWKYKINQD